MASGGLRYYLSLDTRGFSRGTRQAEGDLSRLQRVSGTSFNAMRLGGLAAAAAVGTTLAAGIRTGYQEMVEAQKVGAQTAAVIKSTGGAAGITRKQVEDLAGSLQGLTGVEDDAIQSGQNVLLTFTKISKETFPQATRAALDLSVAFGKDMTSSSLMVGKALQDPIKGVSALTRVGVSFTAQQKDQIKAMVEAGKTADAQKLILAELNKQVGGSGAAFGKTLPGQIERAKRAWEDVTQELMTQLLPAFTDMVQFVNRNMPRIRAAIQSVADTVRGVVKFVRAIIAQDWAQAWGLARTAAVKAIQAIAPALRNLGGWLLSAAADAGRAIGRGLYNGIYAALQKLPGPVRRFLGLSGSTDTTNVSGGQNFDFGAGPVTSRATGGWIPGRYDARDDVPVLLSRGEVVLNPRQASLVGVGRINSALAATGGVMGGSRFARGGVVQSAYDRAVGKLGTKYEYGKWDCSKFATYVAGVGVGGTTATAYGMSSPASGDEAIVWGFRRNGGGNTYDGGKDEHMGVRVNGRWFDNGSNGVESNADSQRWQQVRVPRGLENLVAGGDTGTATRDAPAKDFGQIIREAFGKGRLGKTWRGVSEVTTGGPGGSRSSAVAPGSPLTVGGVVGAYRGGVPDLSEGYGTSPDGADSRGIDKAGRDARARARAAGKSPEEVRKAGDDAEEDATKKWYRGEIRKVIADMTKLKKRKKRLLAAIRVVRAQKAKNLGAKRQVIRSLNNRVVQINTELSELREIKAELENTLGEIIEEGQAEDYEEGYPDPTDADSEPGGATEGKVTTINTGLTDYLASIGEFGAVKRGAGDLGAGGRTAWDATWTPAGGAVTVVVQTLHPGDPSVLAEVGRTVVASMAGLPSTPSTTYMSGA